MSEHTTAHKPLTATIVVGVTLAVAFGMFLWLRSSAEPDLGSFTAQYEYHKTDEIEFILEPFQSLEYTYLMDRGSPMVFSWQANGELYYDLRARNTTVRDHEESYAQGLASEQMGSYSALFNGMHGWFWENRGFEDITVRLKTSGFYVNATESRTGSSSDRSPSAVF